MEDFITRLAPVCFVPDARCDRWLEFLDRIMDSNQDLIDFLQRAVGYALTGETSEQVLFIFWGGGANGKSTFLQAMSHVLGDYAMSTPTETLLVKRRGAIPNDVARLKGARFVVACEADAENRLAESLIKQMTGGDTMTARFLHQEFFEFEPTHKVFFGTNHKPVVKGADYAIWRRIKLVPFTITIPEEETATRLRMAAIHLDAARSLLGQQQYAAAEARLREARKHAVVPSSAEAARLRELEAHLRDIRGR